MLFEYKLCKPFSEKTLTYGSQMSREYVVSVARKWLGTAYHHQASVRGVGCDCLGLLRGVYREVMGSEPESPPPYSADWAEALGCETLIEAVARHLDRIDLVDAREGDVLIFRMNDGAIAKHCAILTGPDTMIDSMEGVGVCETHLNIRWVRRVAAVFRFPGIV
jgi:NlpC/P60 family putative phage cell wall peptidase